MQKVNAVRRQAWATTAAWRVDDGYKFTGARLGCESTYCPHQRFYLAVTLGAQDPAQQSRVGWTVSTVRDWGTCCEQAIQLEREDAIQFAAALLAAAKPTGHELAAALAQAQGAL